MAAPDPCQFPGQIRRGETTSLVMDGKECLSINKQLKDKISEALSSVLPVSVIILLLGMSVTPLSLETCLLFLAGTVLLVVGMGLFTLGADMAMMPMGEALGRKLGASRKTVLVAGAFLVMGVLVTVVEPDLTVLASQVPGIPNMVLIWTVALGVGLFMVISFLRTLFKVPLRAVLLVSYIVVFGLSFFIPRNMLAVAFDSGGVTTGPITVPFIMALGLGLSAVRGDKEDSDSFGTVSLASVGPILAVLVLGLVYRDTDAQYEVSAVAAVSDGRDVAAAFLHALPHYGKEVLIALTPMVALFLIFQLVTRSFKAKRLAQIGVGLIYTFVGLVVFLTGVNVGFLPAGRELGTLLGGSSYSWTLILLGALLGWFIVNAEPAVHVLCAQVETVTSGAVNKQVIGRALSIGMAVSLALAMARILWSIPLYAIIIPGYALAFGLSFVVPPMFTGIAFDSGGVASGPMTATFLLPFAMGACEAMGGNVMLDAFGVVALVAMTPLIIIQLMGLSYQRKLRRRAQAAEEGLDEILVYDVSQYLNREVSANG